MDAKRESEQTPMKNATSVERKSERELVVTRTVNGSARIVFKAWTTPELFKQWWVPKSFGLSLLSCEMDVRIGGRYRLVFSHEASTMEFFGTYLAVIPHSRLVWTNDEGDDGSVITTVTFEEQGSKTLLVVHDLYPSKQVLDAAISSGATSGMPETLEQLDEFLGSLGATRSPDGQLLA
ncbi:MAG: SRPBCC family protein [Pseudomonadota bacterium]